MVYIEDDVTIVACIKDDVIGTINAYIDIKR